MHLSSEEKEVDRYSRDNFNVELNDDPLNFWNTIKDYIRLLHLLPVTFYAYHLQLLQLKGSFPQVDNQNLERGIG